MPELTEKEQRALERIPFDGWINQLQVKTSRSVMTKLFNIGLVRRKVVDNPTGDPRRGMVYQRKKKASKERLSVGVANTE